MKNFKNKKTLQIVLLVVIAVVTLGIGYAAISAVNLIINGNATASVNQNNFKVHFTQAQAISGSTGASGTSSIDTQDDTKAMFDVTGLTKVGDYAEAVYIVRNDSNGIGAEISLSVSNSNSEYFKVTETILDDKLQAGEETTAKVKVEMIKTPVTDSVSTTITATLTASPLEDAEATGGEEKSKVKPGTFAGDSWKIIAENVRNGNTDDYHIGDTKIVQIDINDDGVDEDYIVRVANKSTPTECNDENFSQTACGFVIEFTQIIEARELNSEPTNVGGWPGSELYQYVQNDLYNKFPQDLKQAIILTKTVSGYANNGIDSNNFTSFDKLYLLSGKEVFNIGFYNGDNTKNDTAADYTRQLDYYSQYSVEKIYGVYDLLQQSIKESLVSSDKRWRLRGVFSDSDRTSSTSVGGPTSGTLCTNDISSMGLSPAFRIG